VVTTCANLQDFMTQIPVHKLTKTVQDAIAAAQNLGYKYLWVDALCIIQDSDSDKAVEISKMAIIDSNSTLTISAEEAACATEGFLKSHGNVVSENEFLASNVPFRHPNGTQGHFDLCKPAVPATKSTGAIHKRAWTFQEHFLSRRVLYFGRDLHWECFMGKISNSGTTETFESVGLRSRGLNLAPDEPDEAIYSSWGQLVETLMLREISNPYDRLNALSGIALNFGTRLGDSYLAGIWQKDVWKGLCWYQSCFEARPPDQVQLQHPTERVGPTWSWASLSHPTLHLAHTRPSNQDAIRAELIESAVTLVAGASKYGQVTTGTLILRGSLERFDQQSFLKQFEFEDKETKGWREVQENRVWLDQHKTPVFTNIKVQGSHKRGDVTQKDFWLFEIFFANQSEGLVLTKEGDGTFKRVGYFHGHLRHAKVTIIKLI
jgi:hypothetical protein